MEKEILKNYLEDGYSLNQISKLVNKSLTTVRYWKNKYSLESTHKTFKEKEKKEYDDTRICPRCKLQVKTENFYQKRGIPNSSSYCKSCTTEQTLERMQKLKSQMVSYKGGCCSKCGYNKYYGALEFHHLDPKEKDFNPSHLKKYSFDDKVKSELDKCILLCSNCHRETHHELRQKSSEFFDYDNQ